MHYPEQRYVTKSILVRRKVLLPDNASGTVTVAEGKRVDFTDVVAQGFTPATHLIIDVASALGLRRRRNISDVLYVGVGDVAEESDVLAGRSATRGRRVFAPVRGIVVAIDDGNIFFQEMPEIIDLTAGMRGLVKQIYPGRGVAIEANGALLQGVWGNEQRAFATLRIEPDQGLENINTDSLDTRYSGVIVVTRRSITARALAVMEDQGLAGIIGPSCDFTLHRALLKADGAIMLTEGFGTQRMGIGAFGLLSDLTGLQVALDAHHPTAYSSRRPEMVAYPQSDRDVTPIPPNIMLTLRPAMSVRIIREPYAGQIGRVIDLPKTPILMDNGLRVDCAQVELPGGETTYIPLVNLEIMGR